MGDIAAEKAALRAAIRQRRARLRHVASDDDWAARGHRIAAVVLELPAVRAAVHPSVSGSPIAVYESKSTEPPTEQLTRALLDLGAQVLTPVAATAEALHWVALHHDRRSDQIDHVASAPGTRVATNAAELTALGCSLVITPALAVGRDHSRLGQGGGYFDRFIAAVRSPAGGEAAAHRPYKPITFVALVGPGEVLATVPHDELDQSIDDWCVG